MSYDTKQHFFFRENQFDMTLNVIKIMSDPFFLTCTAMVGRKNTISSTESSPPLSSSFGSCQSYQLVLNSR